MKRILLAVLFALSVTPAYAQQWDQVNGSMQVKSGPSAPLVIVDQTNAGQKIQSWRSNGTEVCSINTSGDFTCVGSYSLAPLYISTNLVEQRNGTTAQRFNVANTYTSATNNELFSVDWQTTPNLALIGTRSGSGGGSGRGVAFISQGVGASGFAGVLADRSNALIRIGFFSSTPNATIGSWALDTTGAAATWIKLGEATSSATSGTVNPVAITPTYNQSSGTAANTDLLINRTETAVGSGQQLLIQGQTGGTTRYYVTAGGATGRGTQEMFSQAVAPTCTSANNCGTGNGTFATGSSDTAGSVTLGTTPASGFVITFNGTWVAAPVCNVWMNKAGMVVGKTVLTSVTTTTTITVVTNGTAPATGDIYAYRCTGLQ